MGLFDFVKDAGEKVFGRGERKAAEAAAEAAAAEESTAMDATADADAEDIP